MRLNAYLAKAGVSSRRGADVLIKAGRVTINGQPGQLNSQVSDGDDVKVSGQSVGLKQDRYILLYKPSGYITTLKDPNGRRKVIDLVDVPERLVPVGRLDYDTTGALLLTNDGQLAHRLMHPAFEIEKVYEATIEGKITPEILNKLSIGVDLIDGKTAPAKARQLPDNKIELIIHEGRNHQVKRMLDAVGLKVTELHRPKYGSLDLDGLQSGQWRELSSAEIQKFSAR